jgi:hypothetical protein
LQNAEVKGGADYFKYDAFTNNCQMYINLLLDANNLNSEAARQFVLQDVGQLLKRIPSYTSGVARFATDLGALADVAIHGEGKKIVMEPSDFFKEHTDLVKLLDTIATTLHKEARGQATEAKGWRRKLEGRSTKMVGGVRLNGMMVDDGDGAIHASGKVRRFNNNQMPPVIIEPTSVSLAGLARGVKGDNPSTDVTDPAVVSNVSNAARILRDRTDAHIDVMRPPTTVRRGRGFLSKLNLFNPFYIPYVGLKHGIGALAKATGLRRGGDHNGCMCGGGGGECMCGCGAVLDRFKQQLDKAGLSPKRYLDTARAAAKRAGYDPKSVEFSDTNKHKLMIRTPEGSVKRFGAVGNGDFIIWSAIDRAKAATKRNTFHKSHGAMKGDWRADKYSHNNLALGILW